MGTPSPARLHRDRTEAVPLDPARIRHHRLDDPTALDAAIAAAGATVDKCAEHDVTTAAGRVDDLGGDVWDSVGFLLLGQRGAVE